MAIRHCLPTFPPGRAHSDGDIFVMIWKLHHDLMSPQPKIVRVGGLSRLALRTLTNQSMMREWRILRLKNQAIRFLGGLQKRFDSFLAHLYVSLKSLQVFYGQVVARERRQPPYAGYPVWAPFQIVFERTKKEKRLILFFF